MKNCLYIGVFGFFGAILRYFIKNIHIYHYKEIVPINTILINVTGSFILALILTFAFEIKDIKEEIRLGIATGFLGAYTTFSTFMYEGFNIFEGRKKLNAFIYIIGSLFIGIVGFLIGFWIGKVL